jgi:O-antigen/teichoic acid export membrane protein
VSIDAPAPDVARAALMLRNLYKSPALRVAAAFGVGGASFSLGSLILARQLTAEQYGLVSLVVGITSFSTMMAPLGIDFAITRNGLMLGSFLRRVTLTASLLTGALAALVGALLYALGYPLLVCLLVATAAGGISQVTAAHFQSQRQFAVSVPVTQASNWALLIAAVATVIARADGAVFPSAVLAATTLAFAAAGWWLVARRTAAAEPVGHPPHLWGEALSLLTTNAASALFLQLERLVIPGTVGINELALFGVLAALVGSPFRMIQGAAAFTLVPRLREAATAEARRHLLVREAGLMLVVMLAGSAVIWLLAPPIARLMLRGRYELTAALMIATIVSGVLKVVSAFTVSVASTLGPARSLRVLGFSSWVCVGIGIGAAFALARFGLVGVLYGVSLGWLVRCLIAGWLSWRYLRRSA